MVGVFSGIYINEHCGVHRAPPLQKLWGVVASLLRPSVAEVVWGPHRGHCSPVALSLCLTLTSTLPLFPARCFISASFPHDLFSVVILYFFPPLCYCRFLIGLLSPPRAISVCSYSSNCCFTWEDKDTLLSCCHCIKDLFYRIYRVSFKGKKKKSTQLKMHKGSEPLQEKMYRGEVHTIVLHRIFH